MIDGFEVTRALPKGRAAIFNLTRDSLGAACLVEREDARRKTQIPTTGRDIFRVRTIGSLPTPYVPSPCNGWLT